MCKILVYHNNHTDEEIPSRFGELISEYKVLAENVTLNSRYGQSRIRNRRKALEMKAFSLGCFVEFLIEDGEVSGLHLHSSANSGSTKMYKAHVTMDLPICNY